MDSKPTSALRRPAIMAGDAVPPPMRTYTYLTADAVTDLFRRWAAFTAQMADQEGTDRVPVPPKEADDGL